MEVDYETAASAQSSQLSGTASDDAASGHLWDVPLSEIMRPTSLEDYVGQDHLLNEDKGLVKNFLRLGYLPSMILYGPPGVGKTTLASILADEAGCLFVELSATDGSIADLRQLAEALKVENSKRLSRHEDMIRIVVFIDEIHRFQKNQQDFLLPLVEAGTFTFIGATTVDPQVRIRKAILSRCQLFCLHKLTNDDLQTIITRALLQENIRRRTAYDLNFIALTSTQRLLLIDRCSGDSRALINAVEVLSANCIGEAYRYVRGAHDISVPNSTLESSLASVYNASAIPSPRLAPVYKKLFETMNFDMKHSTNSERSKLPEKRSQVQQKRVNEQTKSTNRTKLRKPDTVPEKVDTFYSTFEFGYVLPTDRDKEKEYARHIEVSDTSDEDNVPETYLSDSIDAYGSYQDQSELFKSVEAGIYTVLYLLQQKESPFALAKELILFTVLYTESDKSQFIKTMALVKTLKAANVNVRKVLSNCVERLTKLKKRKSTVPDRLKLAERFLIDEEHRKQEPIEVLCDPIVDFDKELVKLLLEAPPHHQHSKSNDFMVEPLDLTDEFTFGQPFSGREVSADEVLAKLEESLGTADLSSIFSVNADRSSTSAESARTVDTAMVLQDLAE